MAPLKRLRADLGTGKNLEIYLTAIIALVVGVLGVFDIVEPRSWGAATQATLALVAVNALGPRHQVTDLDSQVARASEVRLAGVTLSRTVRAHVEDLRKALARGASVNVLLIDPEGSAPEEAERRSTIPGEDDGVIHVELGTAGRDPVFTLTPGRDHFWYEHFKEEFGRLWEVGRPATEADWHPGPES
ncbi:hypothetical protein [Nonomuraea sp. CA-141351]|uniref:hypothetical protein n=1 Tax=Nonomuraea sp. CA-141351 TaxID=3239996 RepID=UPI003D92977C